jgi:hypothetical protein
MVATPDGISESYHGTPKAHTTVTGQRPLCANLLNWLTLGKSASVASLIEVYC